MKITNNFKGGNINVISVADSDVFVEREVRDGTGYFYWAFCVTGAAGKTLRFIFPGHTRVGRFGAAVSHDLKSWWWSQTKEIVNGVSDAFSYTFSEYEDRVYFAHDMIYSEEMLDEFLEANNIKKTSFYTNQKRQKRTVFYGGRR